MSGRYLISGRSAGYVTCTSAMLRGKSRSPEADSCGEVCGVRGTQPILGREFRRHVMTDTHEVFVGGQRAAQVKHAGIFGDKYAIDSAFGYLTARGRFDGGDYTVDRDGTPIARMVRKFSLREKFAIDIADGENQAFLLALVLAIEAIHDERRQRQHRGGLGINLAGGGIAG
ncbi:MAG: hypothetical protein J2P28_01735 [Actinobacteria bacterium]|nr:hypothetical protein [Actinomycetota bacterium]